MTKELLDADGENRAVRSFLMLYGGQHGISVGSMKAHMKMCGLPHWPEWADKEPTSAHLTKGGAQDWLRHLFALEQSANQLDDIDVVDTPAQQQELQTCKCRWDGEVQVKQCTLHEAHVSAIHEWAERAKAAEAKLKEQPDYKALYEKAAQQYNELAALIEQPAQQEPVAIVAVDGIGQIQIGWMKKPQHNDKLYTSPLAQRKPLSGWIAVSDRIPLESDGEVLVRMRDGRCEIAWATYWHGASNAFAQWTFRDPDEDEAPTHWIHIPTIEAAHGAKERP